MQANRDLDLVIRGGRIITAHDDYVADVGIIGEKIAVIGEGLHGKRELDASTMYVLPGAIDGHVHIRTEGAEDVYDDNFEDGTIAAAFGGVTTILDQAHVEPGTTLREGVQQRLLEATQSLVDYGLHVNLREPNRDRLAEIPTLIAGGFPSFKFFMNYDTYELPDEIIFAGLQLVGAGNGLGIIHAEHRALIDELTRQDEEAGRTGLEWYSHARPAEFEAEATFRALAMADVAGARSLIFHVTAEPAVRELRAARGRGQEAYGEVCTHYALLGEEALQHPISGSAFQISPPLRTKPHRDALWSGLADGTLDITSSDHGPRRLILDVGGVLRTPPGTSGVEVRLALFHTFGVLEKRLTLNRWVDVCCSAPAEIFGLPTKGRIEPGYDADVVVFDPNSQLTLSPQLLHSNVDHSTYDGFRVRGWPVTTISRGEILVDHGRLVAEPGRGRLADRGYK